MSKCQRYICVAFVRDISLDTLSQCQLIHFVFSAFGHVGGLWLLLVSRAAACKDMTVWSRLHLCVIGFHLARQEDGQLANFLKHLMLQYCYKIMSSWRWRDASLSFTGTHTQMFLTLPTRRPVVVFLLLVLTVQPAWHRGFKNTLLQWSLTLGQKLRCTGPEHHLLLGCFSL